MDTMVRRELKLAKARREEQEPRSVFLIVLHSLIQMIKSFFGFFGVKITPQSTGGVAYAIRWMLTGMLLIVGVYAILYLIRQFGKFMQNIDRMYF
jgi:uncharacterized membrane protein YdbT with pleckstrin-like domain